MSNAKVGCTRSASANSSSLINEHLSGPAWRPLGCILGNAGESESGMNPKSSAEISELFSDGTVQDGVDATLVARIPRTALGQRGGNWPRRPSGAKPSSATVKKKKAQQLPGFLASFEMS
ncbi:hypothetical protein [Cupriavidus necator]|uniref:hypothetical protein n=1 Tax=Cupriavidus necator TaxID=106590 RepID=UPI000F500FE0|nr:hypothetical protein [Cupriavidus necator]